MLYTTTRCQVRKLEMAASAIDLAAAFGWCVTWWMSYERLPGRGWTLDDPDTWSNLTTLVGALLYFAYNVRVQVSPGDYWDPSSSGYYIFVVRPQLRSACGAPSRLSLHFYHVCRAPSSRRSMATSSTLSAPSSTSSMRCVMMAGEAWRHFYDEAARLFLRKLPMPSSLPTSHASKSASSSLRMNSLSAAIGRGAEPRLLLKGDKGCRYRCAQQRCFCFWVSLTARF